MAGLRSVFLQTRSEAAERIVRELAPKGFTVNVEPIARFTKKRPGDYTEISGLYDEYKPTGGNWKPKGGHVSECHINVKDEKGETVLQVWVEPFFLGKPKVGFKGEGNRETAEAIARQIKEKGKYIFEPKVEERIELDSWVYPNPH